MAKKANNKKPARKELRQQVWANGTWTVKYGKLVPTPGRPPHETSLFEHVAEKIPYAALHSIQKHFVENQHSMQGVYIAHDSMGYARYVGRGNVFTRLKAHHKAHEIELHYFSFYIVASKKHEREIETIMIRLGGPHLHFNDRKKRVDATPGNILDFEPGTHFIERTKNSRTKVKPKK